MLPSWLALDLRPPPGANVVLVRGPGRPALLDAGSGTVVGTARTEAFLRAEGVAPGDLRAVVCTHFHDDHVGGCAWLQREHGVPVAAHAAEAALVDARDPRACDLPWLGLAVGPYVVDRTLEDGDVVDVGPGFEVVHVPSQAPGHIALWQPEDRVLVTGDHLQAGDVAWVPFGGNPWADGALERSIAAVERLGALGARVAVSGHGPPVTDVPAAVEASLARYAAWRADPSRMVAHFMRRIVVGGIVMRPAPVADPHVRFAGLPCVEGAAGLLGVRPRPLVEGIVEEMLERRVLAVRGADVVPAIPHEPPSPLRVGPGRVDAWPAAGDPS